MLVFGEYSKIGGVGVIVEIGERKYNRGKRVEGKWVLIEWAETLIEITKKCFAREHRPLGLLEILQLVNGRRIRSKNFKDPITGVHTNSIEGTWSAIKSKMKKDGTNKCKDQFDSYLATYMFRRTYQCSYRALFKVFLRGIGELYTPQTCDLPGEESQASASPDEE
ncbi:hypothetical protein HNY73_007062 [Argiope bruennichi]|uniref:ISXO2-like transposase domain-containing protein n=1 Tax=Argiope bruennichi TaxID=94029 RepID=A0A8T0FFU2_ARGBR|nr:hypothetical protein HNY73_007062 [Argiope bruennichi]